MFPFCIPRSHVRLHPQTIFHMIPNSLESASNPWCALGEHISPLQHSGFDLLNFHDAQTASLALQNSYPMTRNSLTLFESKSLLLCTTDEPYLSMGHGTTTNIYCWASLISSFPLMQTGMHAQNKRELINLQGSALTSTFLLVDTKRYWEYSRSFISVKLLSD